MSSGHIGSAAIENAAAKEASLPLLERANYLLPKDRQLIELVFKNRMALRQISGLIGQPPGTISRRVQRLCVRLSDPLVAALLDARIPLSPDYRQLAIEFFLEGRTSRELADLHRITPVHVKKMIEYVRGWFRGTGGVSKLAGPPVSRRVFDRAAV